jgi:hypothetical protein
LSTNEQLEAARLNSGQHDEGQEVGRRSRDQERPRFSETMWTWILLKRWGLIGMAREQARLAWGLPNGVSRYTTAAGVTEHWHHYGGSLMFVIVNNYKLTVIRN